MPGYRFLSGILEDWWLARHGRYFVPIQNRSELMILIMVSMMEVMTFNPGFLTDDQLVASFCVRTHEFDFDR